MISLLVRLARIVADARGVSLWRIGHLAAGRGSFFVDIAAGQRSCTVSTYDRVLQWFSDHWPADLEWPSDIPRPDPSPDSPAAEAASISISTPETEITDPLAAVEAAMERQGAAMDRADWDAARAAGAEVLAAGGVLGDDGQIACPEALCLALGISRSTYQHVIAQYANGGPREGDEPRRLAPSALGLPRQSTTERMLRALVVAGDARFRTRVERAAQTAELAQRLGPLGMSAT